MDGAASGPRVLAGTFRRLMGQSWSALPLGSDVDLLGEGKGVIYFDAEIAHRALYLGMAKKELDGP